MPRPPSNHHALTIGQLARRWNVSIGRVRSLVESGQIPGAFTIPSAGCYGSTVKIPLEVVLQLETEEWAVVPSPSRARPKPRKRKSGDGPALRHFPELAATDLHGDGSPGGAQD